jgi:hypothetical protein
MGRCDGARRWLRLRALRSGGGVGRGGAGEALAAGPVGRLQPDPVGGRWPRCAGGSSSGISSISTPSTTARDPGAYDYFAVTAGPRTLAGAVFRACALGQPDRDSGQPATRIARHDGAGTRPAAEARAREGRVSLWRYMRLFRRDILSAQPERLYRAWMAEFRTPFFRSFLVNQPDLVEEILKAAAAGFPEIRPRGRRACARFWGRRSS